MNDTGPLVFLGSTNKLLVEYIYHVTYGIARNPWGAGLGVAVGVRTFSMVKEEWELPGQGQECL